MVNISIWPIDRTLRTINIADHSGPGSNRNKGYFSLLKSTGLKPHHQIQFTVISRKFLLGGSYLSTEIHYHNVTQSERISLTPLTTAPYHSSLPAGPKGYIPYLHRAAVRRFMLVALLLLGHVKGSTRVHHLWDRPYFSSSVPHVWLV